MTGPEHYLEAERLIGDDPLYDPPSAGNIALAQVHATLALAAATAMGHCDSMDDFDYMAWDKACGVTVPGVRVEAGAE